MPPTAWAQPCKGASCVESTPVPRVEHDGGTLSRGGAASGARSGRPRPAPPEWLSTTSLRQRRREWRSGHRPMQRPLRRVHLLAVCPPAVPNLSARPRWTKPRGRYSALKPPICTRQHPRQTSSRALDRPCCIICLSDTVVFVFLRAELLRSSVVSAMPNAAPFCGRWPAAPGRGSLPSGPSGRGADEGGR